MDVYIEARGAVLQSYTLYCQKYALTCLYSHINFSDILFLINIPNPIPNRVHPLQLEQLQLFWEGCPRGLEICLWGFLTILPEAHL